MKRSIAVPLGSLAVLAAAFLAGCDNDDVDDSDRHCVIERRDVYGNTEFVKVDDDECDGRDHPNSTGTYWIIYSAHYDHKYRPGDTIPPRDLGHKVRSTDQAARSKVGFTKTGKVPARGGLGGTTKKGGGNTGGGKGTGGGKSAGG